MCAKGNPNSSCPTILSHSDNDSCVESDSDSREELFNSSLNTVNVSVNTTSNRIARRGMVIGNDTVLPCNEAKAIVVKFSGHVFHMFCYLLECSKDYGLYIGQKAMYELEGGAISGICHSIS